MKTVESLKHYMANQLGVEKLELEVVISFNHLLESAQQNLV
jgi:hypothetical protein